MVHGSTTTVKCAASGGVEDPTVAFSWTSTNAATAFFGIDTTDAQANPFFSQQFSSNSDSTSFPAGYNSFHYTCEAGSHRYTITVVGNGQKASWTVTNTGSTS